MRLYFTLFALCFALLWAATADWSPPGPDDYAQRFERGNIVVPRFRSWTSYEYDAERIITTPVVEFSSEHVTSGRYAVFAMPMKYVNKYHLHDDDVPRTYYMFLGWGDPNGDGSKQIYSIYDFDGRSVVHRSAPEHVNASISTFSYDSTPRLSRLLAEAKAAERPFTGYKPVPGGGPIFWLDDEYCGWEMFEREERRGWHRWENEKRGLQQTNQAVIDETPPPPDVPFPFDRARIFGWPDGKGGYSRVVECTHVGYRGGSGVCNTETPYRGFMVRSYVFDPSLLCTLNTMIEHHTQMLDDAIIAIDESLPAEKTQGRR